MTTEPAPTPAGPRTDRAGTRARILAAARDLVARKGYAGTSISMICREAGINASSLYWFFASKEDLFLAVIEEGAQAFLDAVAVPPPAAQAPGDAAREDTVAVISDRLSRNTLFLRVLLVMMLEAHDVSPAFRARVDEIRSRSLDWWRALLAGLFQPLGASDARQLADDFAPLCRATLNGAFIAEQFGERVSVATILRRLLLLLDGLVQAQVRERGDGAA